MNIEYIFITIGALWLGIMVFYFYVYKPQQPQIIAQAVIEKREFTNNNYNQFTPDNNKIQKLVVNLIYEDKDSIDTSQFCDLVLNVKDIVNYNAKEIKETQGNSYKETKINLQEKDTEVQIEDVQIEKKGDTNFTKLVNINKVKKGSKN